jgi:hypothetical protein
MAEAKDLTVSIEVALHEALREVIQHYADQHGLWVEQVDVEWARIVNGSGTVMDLRLITRNPWRKS